MTFAKRTDHWARLILEDVPSQDPTVSWDLTVSNPTVVNLDYPAAWMDHLKEAARQPYEPVAAGLKSARQAVVNYYARRGVQVNQDQMILTASSSESYGFVLKLCLNPYEKVLIPSPSYPLFPYLLDMHDVAYDVYCLDSQRGWAIDREDFLKKLDQSVKAVMVVSPNNPTGSYLNNEDRNWLIDMAKQHDFVLIVDEVFMDYALEGQGSSCLNHMGDALIFVIGGLSKTACLPQMKMGWLIVEGPKEKVSEAVALLDTMADTMLSVNTPVMVASEKWLNEVDSLQAKVITRLKHNRDYAKNNKGVGMTLWLPEAGWSLMLAMPSYFSDEKWAQLSLEQGVKVMPGYFFDFPHPSAIMISLLVNEEVFHQGFERLCQMK